MHVLVDAILYGLIIRVVLAFKIQLVISITISTAPINNRQHNRDRVLSPPQGCPGPGILRTHVMILHHRTDPYHTRCLQNIRHDRARSGRHSSHSDGHSYHPQSCHVEGASSGLWELLHDYVPYTPTASPRPTTNTSPSSSVCRWRRRSQTFSTNFVHSGRKRRSGRIVMQGRRHRGCNYLIIIWRA